MRRTVRITIFATGNKDSTDLLSVIQILQILIKEVVLLLVTFTAIFMQNNVFIEFFEKLFLCRS